jgi:hypothetical protein
MSSERLERILAAFEAGSGDGSAAQICEVTTTVVGVAGAGIMLMSHDVPEGSLCTSNSVSELIEELQYTLGEGPCIDAYSSNQAVAEVDLANPDVPRWLAFTPRALDVGVRAVFGFPLRGGDVRMGALNLYQDRPGALSEEQHSDALVMADCIGQWVIDAQSAASPGDLAGVLEAGSDFHFIVHNAAGMVSVQLGVPVTEALLRLRAHAFAENRLLRDVAADVVEHHLRFQ